MSLKQATVTEVSCDEQGCLEVLYLQRWQDASKFGWCCPNDGGLHRCPKCQEAFINRVCAVAVTPEQYAANQQNKETQNEQSRPDEAE